MLLFTIVSYLSGQDFWTINSIYCQLGDETTYIPPFLPESENSTQGLDGSCKMDGHGFYWKWRVTVSGRNKYRPLCSAHCMNGLFMNRWSHWRCITYCWYCCIFAGCKWEKPARKTMEKMHEFDSRSIGLTQGEFFGSYKPSLVGAVCSTERLLGFQVVGTSIIQSSPGFWDPWDIGWAKELGMMYFPTRWGAFLESQNLQNQRLLVVILLNPPFFFRWYFQMFFIFIPAWGNDPIWWACSIYFQMGWWTNHQLVTYGPLCTSGEFSPDFCGISR